MLRVGVLVFRFSIALHACVSHKQVRYSVRRDTALLRFRKTGNQEHMLEYQNGEIVKSIVILIDYFGNWPKWFPVFLASCASNRTVDWMIRTDCDIPADAPQNVKFVPVSYADYVADVSRRLGIDFKPSCSYKICDLRPMCGDMYSDEIADYDYFGFGDLDVIYGNIRRFYTDEVLSFDLISTHVNMISGHLVLFKNTERMRKAYSKIPKWKEYLENPNPARFDEDVFSDLFFPRGNANELSAAYRESIYSKEQYSTVFHPMPWHDGMPDHPEVWFWKDGVVTNNRNVGRQYPYLHLMNFQSMRWTSSVCREIHIPWKDNPDTSFPRPGEEIHGVRIDWAGIQPLAQ